MNNLTVVMYHYVRPIRSSRYPGIRGLEFDDFVNQIEFLSTNYNVVTIEQVMESFLEEETLPKNAALLTFDDAYIDHFNNVYPVLRKNGMQGCFYTPAKVIKKNLVLDVNKIHFILASCDDPGLIVKDIKKYFEKIKKNYDVREFDSYYEELSTSNRFDKPEVIFIKRILQMALPEKMRNEICDALFERYVGMDEVAFSKEIYMGEHHLEHMIKDGMHVGCHGYDHYWWNRLEKHQLEKEIDLSLEFLKRIGTDINRWTACYPYGSASEKVVEVLKNKGCSLAFTTEVDVADTRLNNRLLIPRLDTNDLPKDRNATPNKWYK